MDIEQIEITLKESIGVFNEDSRTDILLFLERAFKRMKAKGNTKLVLQKRFWKDFSNNDSQYSNIDSNYRTKFKGNKTRDYISLFLEFENETFVNCYDVFKFKRKVGLVPMDDNQLLIFPVHWGECWHKSYTLILVNNDENFSKQITAAYIKQVKEIWEPPSYEKLIDLLPLLETDVLLLASQMPDGEAIDYIEDIKKIQPGIKIIILSSDCYEENLLKYMLDTDGLIGAYMEASEIVHAIKMVAKGEKYLVLPK